MISALGRGNRQVWYRLSRAKSRDLFQDKMNTKKYIHFFCVSKRNESKKKTLFQRNILTLLKTTPKTMRCCATEIHRFSPYSGGKENPKKSNSVLMLMASSQQR